MEDKLLCVFVIMLLIAVALAKIHFQGADVIAVVSAIVLIPLADATTGAIPTFGFLTTKKIRITFCYPFLFINTLNHFQAQTTLFHNCGLF